MEPARSHSDSRAGSAGFFLLGYAAFAMTPLAPTGQVEVRGEI